VTHATDLALCTQDTWLSLSTQKKNPDFRLTFIDEIAGNMSNIYQSKFSVNITYKNELQYK